MLISYNTEENLAGYGRCIFTFSRLNKRMFCLVNFLGRNDWAYEMYYFSKASNNNIIVLKKD